LIVVII